MNLLDALLLADANIGAGIGAGIPIGIGAGIGIGSGGAKKKLKRQLSQAIDDGAITILGKSGDELTVDALLEMLNQDYKKV